MTNKILLNLFIISVALFVHAQSEKSDQSHDLTVDDFNTQGSPGMFGDKERTNMDDLKFDSEMNSNFDRPSLPNAKKVKRLYKKLQDDVVRQAKNAGEDDFEKQNITFPKKYKFSSLVDWQKGVQKCCPYKEHYYRCYHSTLPMPCFQSFYGSGWEWCCPFWPKMKIARCECCQCAVLYSTCAHEGRCQRRYTLRRFLAVCYRKGWNYIRYIRRYLPTSCYCRIS